jgi:hypothetical protein
MTVSRTPHATEINWGAEPASARSVYLTRASSIAMRPVKWAWQDLLPLGSFSLLGGREGIGKSICYCTVAADLTRGPLPGDCFGQPRSVIVATTEDSREHTVVPRLTAAGADLDRVHFVDVTTAEAVDTTLSLPRDLAAVGRVVREVDAALVVLDPLLSRLEGTLDTHKDSDVRRALEPVASLADSSGAAVWGLIHVNKSTSSEPLNTLMASRAFPAVARSVLFVMTDPEDEQVRLLGIAKSNLGRLDIPTRSFRIVGVKVAETAEGDVWTGKLEWLGETARTIREASEAAAATSGDKTATSEAADWLADYLAIQGGPADSALIKREGHKAGHSESALKRARLKLQVTAASHGYPRKTFWSLPASVWPVSQVSPGESELIELTEPTEPTESQSVQSGRLVQSDERPVAAGPTGGNDGVRI